MGSDGGSFADRLTALVSERASQVCLGLDPDPGAAPWGVPPGSGSPSPAERREATADAVERRCIELIDAAGDACVAVKPQLARFEALGWPGWRALERVCFAARNAGLLVVADGKRGDVPHTAAAYADALFNPAEAASGLPGLGADAATVNPLLGADSLSPFVERARLSGAGVFVLVRTSNPGARDVFDLVGEGGEAVHERIAKLVDAEAGELLGDSGLSGAGAVVGATEPQFIARLRELMPRSIFLLPGVGAQGGEPEMLTRAFAPGRAGALVAASRSIAAAEDPAAAVADLRDRVWAASVAAAS